VIFVPLIAMNLDITSDLILRTRMAYVEGVQKSGGHPLMLAPMDERGIAQVLCQVDGLVMIGGDDYAPQLYGEEPLPSVQPLHPLRQEFDLALLKYALLKTDLPILGICGGAQAINLALGGSLIQDIPTAWPNSQTSHSGNILHGIRLARGSRLSQIYGSETIAAVVSAHHQAVKRLGDGLMATAYAPDGVIEGIELRQPGRFVVGVQWHPERDHARSKILFDAFIQECSR